MINDPRRLSCTGDLLHACFLSLSSLSVLNQLPITYAGISGTVSEHLETDCFPYFHLNSYPRRAMPRNRSKNYQKINP